MLIAMVGSHALVMPLSRAASRRAPAAFRIAACAASTDLPPLPSGFIVVDKPPGWTSFDVVGKVRGTMKPEGSGGRSAGDDDAAHAAIRRVCRDTARDSGMTSAVLPLNATISIDDWRVLWRVLWRAAADSKATSDLVARNAISSNSAVAPPGARRRAGLS